MRISHEKYLSGNEYFETTFQFASGHVLEIEWRFVDGCDKRQCRERGLLQSFGYDSIAEGILCRFTARRAVGRLKRNVLSCKRYPDIAAFLLGLDDVREGGKRRMAGFDMPPGFLFPMFDYLVESGGELGEWIEERMGGVWQAGEWRAGE